METLDEQQDKIPNEAIVEIKSMCKWMTFSGVMTIILGVLFLLGIMGNGSKVPNAGFSIIMQLLSIGLAFLLISKSSAFNKYAELRNEADLMKALKSNQLYWLASVILILVNILISLTIR